MPKLYHVFSHGPSGVQWLATTTLDEARALIADETLPPEGCVFAIAAPEEEGLFRWNPSPLPLPHPRHR